MKLPVAEAKQCLHLLDGLDAFTLKTSNLVKKGDVIFVNDPNEFRVKIRDYWQHHPDMIEKFIAQTPDLSAEDIEIIRGWKQRVRTKYLIIKCYRKYAVLSSYDDNKLYGVLALSDDFKTLIPNGIPAMISTSLLPFKGLIVWDGLVECFSLAFGKEITYSLQRECDAAKKAGKIIFHF